VKYSGADVQFILVDGYNLLGVTTEISDISVESILEESHTLGDSWQESTAVGVRKAMLSQDGFYDDAAGSVNAVFADQQATQRSVCIGITSSAFIGIQGAFGSKYVRKLDRDKLHKAKINYTISGQVDEGLILQALATKTADWDTTASPVDNGSATTNGGVAYQQVTALSGFTGFVGKVRHSADNVTYADLVTFTNVTSAPNAQRSTVNTGTTINRYLAYAGDVTGTGSISVMTGFSRG